MARRRARPKSPARARTSTGPTSRSSCRTTSWTPGATSARAAPQNDAWRQRLAALDPPSSAPSSSGASAAIFPSGFDGVIDAYKQKLAADAPEIATRKAGEAALNVIAPAVPELVTGSADLTASNNTKVAATPGNHARRLLRPLHPLGHPRARHGRGLQRHCAAGGFIPSGASFLCFTDYCRPSLRLAALMGIRVVHVFTHDSIGLGEDGPTHQPVEHLAALRAMPNLYLWRPADSVETVECWQAALENRTRPRSSP